MLPAQSNQYESELKIFESCSGTLRQSLERVFFFTTAKKISADTKLSEKKMSQSRDEYAAVYDFLDNILGTLLDQSEDLQYYDSLPDAKEFQGEIEELRNSLEKCEAIADYINPMHRESILELLLSLFCDISNNYASLLHKFKSAYKPASVFDYALKVRSFRIDSVNARLQQLILLGNAGVIAFFNKDYSKAIKYSEASIALIEQFSLYLEETSETIPDDNSPFKRMIIIKLLAKPKISTNIVRNTKFAYNLAIIYFKAILYSQSSIVLSVMGQDRESDEHSRIARSLLELLSASSKPQVQSNVPAPALSSTSYSVKEMDSVRPSSASSNITSNMSSISSIFGITKEDKLLKKYIVLNSRRFKVTIFNSSPKQCLLIYIENRPEKMIRRLIIAHEHFKEMFQDNEELSQAVIKSKLEQGWCCSSSSKEIFFISKKLYSSKDLMNYSR